LLLPSRMSASHGPTPEAATLIRSSPAAGAGRGTSSTTTTSGAPKRWIRAAFMFAPNQCRKLIPRARSDCCACGELSCTATLPRNPMNLRRLTQTCSSRIKPTIGQRRASQQKIAAEGRDGSKTEAAARRGDVRFTPRNRTRVYEYTPYPRYQLQKRQSSCKDLAPQPGPPHTHPFSFFFAGVARVSTWGSRDTHS
jgi:hypothetical protein